MAREKPPAADAPWKGESQWVLPRWPDALARYIARWFIVALAAQGHQEQNVDMSGALPCAQAKVRGKAEWVGERKVGKKGIPCTEAPLTLKNDGRFGTAGWESAA